MASFFWKFGITSEPIITKMVTVTARGISNKCGEEYHLVTKLIKSKAVFRTAPAVQGQFNVYKYTNRILF